MSEILGGLYSFSNRAKRQLRDLLSNPAAYLEQSAEKLRDEVGRPTSARRVAERAFDPSEADIERSAAWWNPSPLGAMAGVIKQKGGNWLAGSVEDALRGLKRSDPTIGRWIEGPLTKYVKTRMASPEDEVRKLAEQGVLHVDPAQLHAPIGLHSGVTRQELGQSPAAKRWEFASDSFIAPETAGLFKLTRGQDGSTTLSRNPWLTDLPNDATVYDLGVRAHPENLGFPHLIDELSNALDPASGLPRHLQLTPEAMQNLSMEKAVRRVHDINEWRAAQQAELNRQIAEKASLVREYPENNPKGLRWVELKAQEPTEEAIQAERASKTIKFEPEVYAASLRRKWLEDQLKYEGDVMGHCVGGYCEDVLSGRSRIFSLRDAKGEPHVTVEVEPVRGYADQASREELFTPELQQEYLSGVKSGEVPSNLTQAEWARQKFNKPQLMSIKQIKGKGNRAPNEEYLPFVQDFVRNSPLGEQWSDVGDLANTGLLANKLHPSGFITREELEAAAKNPPEGYAPEDFIWPERYAKGGRVTPITIQPGTETATAGTRGRSWDILSE